MSYARRGEEMLASGEFEEALKIFEGMIERNSQDPDAWEGTARLQSALRSRLGLTQATWRRHRSA